MGWKKVLNKISDFLVTSAFVFLIFIVCMMAFSKASGEQPNVFGYELKTVLSGSMEPFLQTGSVIVVRQTGNDEQFNEGDIVTFQTEERVLVTHRIIGVEKNEYIMKGDNNDGADVNPVHEQNIVGKYAGITIPYVGYVMNLVNSKSGSAFMLIIPGLLLLGYAVKTIIGSCKVNKKSIDSEF